MALILKYKQGNMLLDGLAIIIVMVFLAIVFIGSNFAADVVNDEIQNDTSIDNRAKDAMNTQTENFSDFWDNMFIFALVMFWLAAIISSLFIDTHPVFLIISVIGLILITGVVMFLGNSVEEFMQVDIFGDYSDDFPKMTFIMQHLAETFIVISATIGVALYAKTRLE